MEKLRLFFAGSDENVRKMVGISKRGPFLAEVKKAKVDWNPQASEDIMDFQIIK